jgi:sarcosine oxidase
MHLVQCGHHAIGLDRFASPHHHGSSHGETRITRLSVGEGEAYAPFVRRSHAIWRELEVKTKHPLLMETGGLVMALRDGAAQHHGTTNFVVRSAEVANRFGIAHEMLDTAEIARRFPQFLLRGDEIAYFEPDAGMVFPEHCISALLDHATLHGASIAMNEAVIDLRETAEGVLLTAMNRTLEVARVVIAAGPWIGTLLGGAFERLAVPHRQVLH